MTALPLYACITHQWLSETSLTALQIANPSVPALYEDALVYETGSAITSTGALSAYSGAKTGRSPSDKRIVKEEGSEKEIWWGPVNKPMSPDVSISQASRTHQCQCQIPLDRLVSRTRRVGGAEGYSLTSYPFALPSLKTSATAPQWFSGESGDVGDKERLHMQTYH